MSLLLLFCFVGLVVVSATAVNEVSSSNPALRKKYSLLTSIHFIRFFSVLSLCLFGMSLLINYMKRSFSDKQYNNNQTSHKYVGTYKV